jgi:membrane fusion protein (multidrug efflux system)
VTLIELEPGTYVRTGDPVAEMADLAEIEIDVGVDDRLIIALDESSPVRVAADAIPGEWFEGRIASLPRVPDATSQKYRVPVRVPNDEMRLLPGMLGRVRLTLGDESLTIRVPRRAISREYELEFVWVLEPVSQTDAGETVATVRRRRVRVIPVPFRPDLVDVSSGLEEGDIVATSNLRELSEGIRVLVSREEGSEVALP